MGILKIWLHFVGVEFDSLQKSTLYFSSISASKMVFFAFKVNDLFSYRFKKHIIGYISQNRSVPLTILYRWNVYWYKIYKTTGGAKRWGPAFGSRAQKTKNAKEFLKMNEIVWKL